MVFPPTTERAIRDFSARLGLVIPENRHGPYSFRFGHGTKFRLTSGLGAKGVIASLTFECRVRHDRFYDLVFDLVGREWDQGRLIRPALTREGAVVLAACIDETAMSAQALDDSLKGLLEMRRALV